MTTTSAAKPATAPTAKAIDLGRGDTDAKLLAALEIDLAQYATRPEFITAVKLTPDLWKLSEEIGMARNQLALLRGLTGQAYRRGDQDTRLDVEGALGDIVLSALVGPAGWQLTPLVEFTSKPGECDAYTSDGLRVDAKTITATKPDWCNINEKSHQDKAADVYVVVRIRSETLADVYAVPRAFVDGFKVKDGTNGAPYRSVPLR